MHYAEQSFTLARGRDYVQGDPYPYAKPRGFWVSVKGEDDWPTWCRSEGFGVDRLAVEHEVTLTPDANVLRLDSAGAMRDFHQEYAVETNFERRYPRLSNESWPIDWRAVAAKYDGIIIAPYQWSCRLDLSWYYGWDCASGCIWNLDAIASLAALVVAS